MLDRNDLKNDILRIRSELLKAVREFFYTNDFIEVETPVSVTTPALEDHIDAVSCAGGFLRTSPELHMKRITQAGHERIFQIGPCFREGEVGRLHRTEFTMLEWYVTGFDYRDILSQTQNLLKDVVYHTNGTHKAEVQGNNIDLSAPWLTVSVADAFERFAGVTVEEALTRNEFESLLTDSVEPKFCDDIPTVLIDFPIQLGALARAKPSDPTIAERWELYLGGVEIANAYSELTDADEQLRRFQKCAEFRRTNGKPVYPIDTDFMAALEKGMPDCAGCALGLDRLLMIVTGSKHINDVTAF